MATTVILGSGIIGTSTAFYLSKYQPGSSIHLVEASPELFASASGNAAGFLAKDWFGPDAAELGALSFEEHRKLADRDNGADRWGYSPTTSVSYSPSLWESKGRGGRGGNTWCREGGSRASAANDNDATLAIAAPPWLRSRDIEEIGAEGTTAQVDPMRLSHTLLQKCLDAGVHLHQPAKAISVQTDMRGELSSITIADTRTGTSTETDIPCTRILISAGAWSPEVFTTLFPDAPQSFKLPVERLAGHHIVVRSPAWPPSNGKEPQGGCHAVFMERTLGTGVGFSPEIFSRRGGEIYVAGLNSATMPLPDVAADAKKQMSRDAIESLKILARDVIVSVSDEVEEAEDVEIEVVREGLCFRPLITGRGTPILDRIPDRYLGPAVATRSGAEGGVYVAAGHGPWGISLSLGTGKVMAEMIQGRELSVDVSGLRLE